LAAHGNPQAVRFTLAKMKGNTLDFSFSGLKTAVLRWTQDRDMTAEIEASPELMTSLKGSGGFMVTLPSGRQPRLCARPSGNTRSTESERRICCRRQSAKMAGHSSQRPACSFTVSTLIC
jgi:hypothetical protein